jgi:hypothetical protein
MTSSSVNTLRDLLRQFITAGAAIELRNNRTEFEEIWALLEANRLCSILREDDRLFGRQTVYRRSVWSTNAPALSTIYLLAPLFEKESIPHVFIKGPLMLHDLYEDYFFRHSTDIDVLVARESFQRAATILEEIGFAIDPHCKSAYFKIFLGEQHYFPPSEKFTVVDLHQYVRHPSGPATKLMEKFLKPHLHQRIGRVSGAIPTSINLALLLVAYIVKGIMKYEAVGYFLLDLAILLKRMDGEATRELLAEAEKRQLKSALRLCLRAVNMIAPLSPLLEKEIMGRKLALMSDEDLFQQLTWPGEPRTWPRIHALVKTCDQATDLIQAFAWEAGRKVAQKASHARLF